MPANGGRSIDMSWEPDERNTHTQLGVWQILDVGGGNLVGFVEYRGEFLPLLLPSICPITV